MFPVHRSCYYNYCIFTITVFSVNNLLAVVQKVPPTKAPECKASGDSPNVCCHRHSNWPAPLLPPCRQPEACHATYKRWATLWHPSSVDSCIMMLQLHVKASDTYTTDSFAWKYMFIRLLMIMLIKMLMFISRTEDCSGSDYPHRSLCPSSGAE